MEPETRPAERPSRRTSRQDARSSESAVSVLPGSTRVRDSEAGLAMDGLGYGIASGAMIIAETVGDAARAVAEAVAAVMRAIAEFIAIGVRMLAEAAMAAARILFGLADLDAYQPASGQQLAG